MNDEEFRKTLLEAFAVEAEEHLQAITSGLLELERGLEPDPQRELIERIFRDAHSLKGAARAVDRADIEAVCQAMEEIFALWKKAGMAGASESFDILTAAADRIGALCRTAHPVEPAAIASTLNSLRELELGNREPQLSQPPREAVAIPPASREPVAESAPEDSKVQPRESSANETVRIPVRKLDELLLQVEEMVSIKIAARENWMELRAVCDALDQWSKRRATLHEVSWAGKSGVPMPENSVREFLEWDEQFHGGLRRDLAALNKRAARHARSAATMTESLLRDAKQLVMLPFSTLLDSFPRQVRDLSRKQAKEIDFRLEGRSVEIDKRILEEMKDPLIHLIRNAVDHGMELPQERQQRGKPARGVIQIAVSQVGSKVQIVISDDGRGIDLERVKASAARQGVLSPEAAERLDEKSARELIFRTGISSSEDVTELSGRGLGMAIVWEKIRKLGGQIAIETHQESGTTFTILLPVTLATFKGLLVRTGGLTVAIPSLAVDRIARVSVDQVATVESRETIVLDGEPVCLGRLNEALELPVVQPPSGNFLEVVVLGTGINRIAFVVDEILGEQELLVKNLGFPLTRIRNTAAATVLASGTPSPVLSAPDLLKSAVRTVRRAQQLGSDPKGAADEVRRILVVDDSMTSRMLLKNILETAGFTVSTAVDGSEGFRALQAGRFDLVVSDVEMPGLDGFELTSKIRADEKLSEVPVVLVTALGSDEHRKKGLDAGASAYIAKGGFDELNLLQEIRRLV